MMAAFAKKYPKTYEQMRNEHGLWLNDRIYFAEAEPFNTSLNYRPNPENWISLVRQNKGQLNLTQVTRSDLFTTGKIKMVKDIADPTRDFANDLQFKSAMLKRNVSNNDVIMHYQTVQKSENLDTSHTCFVGGTLVHTPRGLVAIQDVNVGDEVLSADPITGQHSQQKVIRCSRTEQQRVIFLQFDYWIDPKLPLIEKLKRYEEIKEQFGMSGIVLPYMHIVATPDHPFWVESKGWVKAKDLTWHDVVVTQDGHKYSQNAFGYDTTPYSSLYKTEDPNIALWPSYSLENGMYALKVDLTTGNIISWNDSVDYKENSTLRKLYNNNPHWEEDLLEQLPEDMREGAEFHGFRQGNYVDPKYVKWAEGEGEVTTTVYNIEVENTHTYFVGEYGIWVHNCDANEATWEAKLPL